MLGGCKALYVLDSCAGSPCSAALMQAMDSGLPLGHTTQVPSWLHAVKALLTDL